MFYTSPFPFSLRQSDGCWHPSHLPWTCLKSLILIFILCTWYKNSKKITTAEIEWDPKIRPSQPYCGIFIDIPSVNFPALCNIHTYIHKDFLLSLKIRMYYFCFCQSSHWPESGFMSKNGNNILSNLLAKFSLFTFDAFA